MIRPPRPIPTSLLLAALTLLIAQPALAEPSLDDLLNLPSATPPKPQPSPADPASQAGTERSAVPGTPAPAPAPTGPDIQVPTEKPSDLFIAAADEMKLAASLLTEQSDTSLTTQRTQQSVVRKLDQLIDQLRQQQQQQGKGQPQQSDTGSDQNQQQQPGPSKPGPSKPSRQPGDPQQGSGEMATEDGQRNDQPLGEKLTEWGNLPPRLRDQLLQGTEDHFSSLYRQLTQRYYQRLAEEAP
jgi:hypothetical protein